MASEKQASFGLYAENPPIYLSETQNLAIQEGEYVINAGAAATITLPAPTLQDSKGNYVQDGTKMTFRSASAFAHVIKTPANALNGADDTATFPATVGTKLELVAANGVWLASVAGSVTLTEV